MKIRGRNRTWLIDLCGGAGVVTLLAAALYFTLVEGQDAKTAFNNAAADVAARRRDLAGLQSVAARQRELLAEREKQLAQTGHVPPQTPTEEYFGHLSALATQHRLKILRHNPVPSQEYPGLREERFAFDVIGAFPDLIEFFRALEASSYWADVSYLRVSSVRQEGAAAEPAAIANLTVSLFSTPHEAAKSEPG